MVVNLIGATGSESVEERIGPSGEQIVDIMISDSNARRRQSGEADDEFGAYGGIRQLIPRG